MYHRFRTPLLAACVIVPIYDQASAYSNDLSYFIRFHHDPGSARIEVKSPMLAEISRTPASFHHDPNGVAVSIAQANMQNNISDLSSLSIENAAPPFMSLVASGTDIKTRNMPYGEACLLSPLAPDQIARLVEDAATRHGVVPEFASAVAWAESRFDRVRNSPKGARGPMQLMPDAASDLGVTDVCDPASNIDGGVRYLRALLDEFGNPLLAAAAYNAGPQAVRDHAGVPPYAETINYLAEILNFQLGLRPAGDQTTQRKSRQLSESSGVVGAASAGRFVGGVMKF